MAKNMSDLGWRRYETPGNLDKIPSLRAGRPELAHTGGLRVLRAGHHGRDSHPGGHFRHWASPSYGFIFLLRGKGLASGATMPPTPMQPGDCLICQPGLWHNYGPPEGANWEEYYCFFDGPVADALFKPRRLQGQHYVVTIGTDTNLPAYFETLLQAIAADDALTTGRALFTIITDIFSSLPSRSAMQQTPHPLLQLAQKLCANPGHSWSFPQLANDLNLTYETFRKHFRQQFGVSPQAWLQRERLHQACVLLTNGQRVQDVALAVGFQDPFHFSRTFHKAMGTSPRAFAQMQRH